ncbi:hypothetical protein STCU_09185 [Strigomonas culicis]|uniref:CCHC-type domain-containing protein n=1 Tax=Strigomonas culicis TaxID=28005 RepID=S9TU36_9TRYP|nr:hypothetical protein STCU_09185 [Strigomonas culicis]|eukprot:EPY20038.1 hypothetical protein STCU_09185 [Strigomonas culicis]
MDTSTAAGELQPLAKDWDDEKNASIDWTNPEEAVANGYTLLGLLSAHAKLAAHLASQPDEKQCARDVFLDAAKTEEQHDMLRTWGQQGLLTPRAGRWCRRCGREGHTLLHCQRGGAGTTTTAAHAVDMGEKKKVLSPMMEKLYAHQHRVEQLKVLEEKKKKREKQTGNRGSNYATRTRQLTGGRFASGGPDKKPKRSEEVFSDERTRGIVRSIDYDINIGIVQVHDIGDIKFFLERVDFGVKHISAGQLVTLKVDTSRDFPLAIDIRPANSAVTLDDVVQFMRRCTETTAPMWEICMLLTHKHGWFDVLRSFYTFLQRGDVGYFVECVQTIVHLITRRPNLEPLHLNVLESFLSFTLEDVPCTTNPEGSFFPEMLLRCLQEMEKTGDDLEEAVAVRAQRYHQCAQYLILLLQFTTVTEDKVAPVQQLLAQLVRQLAPADPAVRATQDETLRLLDSAFGRASMLPIPSAEELCVPPPDPKSSFTPANLPINGGVTYTSAEDFAHDQCRLLRADTFEAVSRILPAACLQLPGYVPSKETLADVEHAHLYDRVRYMGSVVTRDRDYIRPQSYLLQVHPRSARADFAHQLPQGTTVCIITTTDPTRLSNDDVFWCVVSSSNTSLLQSNTIVVSPCEQQGSFDVLARNLERNERENRLDCSILMETAVFMSGYASIFKALRALTGPLAMRLPMSNTIVYQHARNDSAAASSTGAPPKVKQNKVEVPADAAPAAGRGQDLIGCVPRHYEFAFRNLIDSMRYKNTFDEGQDEVMRRLPTSEVMLVQGPPGTGKSFIGCRVVETYVRFKQQITSGDILQNVSIDMLQGIKQSELLPKMGPVVVITFKNHALDEFLVDLLDSNLWDDHRSQVTDGTQEQFPQGCRLVRVGGRSQEQRLDAHNLGALYHVKAEKSSINSLKEKLFILQQQLDRLTKEIHYLETGRVPRNYFERWLTPAQRSHISFEDREAWLRGERYVGMEGAIPPPDLYLQLLRTKMDEALACAAGDEQNLRLAQQDAEDTEDVPRTVFEEMKHEDEKRENNESLNSTYLSVEAMHLARNPPSPPSHVPEDLVSWWSLGPTTRHHYYAYLIQKAIAVKAKDCLTIMSTIEDVVRIRNHAMDEAKLSILRSADVVGLTTTGCAMNQNLLRSLRPSVLVVEEAAEVLECQLIACMTDSLQQVVLIGDHYQLQPKVETFMYEKINHLNLSLFERLARHLSPICLSEQRRMHPALSRLVRPYYHPQPLLDHGSLLARPLITATGRPIADRVPGLAQRAYFWRHQHPEEEAHNSRSKVNTRELRMVQAVVTHLISQGVLQASITVITPYLGQCRMLRSIMRFSSFTDVRVSTVDLFQGDENDVIVLSLVRTAKLTEFIRMRNRLIVACSRARFGFVIVGNDDLLQQCSHWAALLERLRADGCIGDALPITKETPDGVVREEMEADGTITTESLKRELERQVQRSATSAKKERHR